MPAKHPSGRPIRRTKKGIPALTHWPRESAVVLKLNAPARSLAGGFGFRMEPVDDEDFYHMTWAKKGKP